MRKILTFILETVAVVLLGVALVFGGIVWSSDRAQAKMLRQHQAKIQLKTQVITE